MLSTLSLTFNFIDYSQKVQAKEINEEKLFIKGSNGSLSDNYVNYRPIPDNWNPLNATNKELEYYNLPKRPSGGDKLKRWEKLVSCKFIKPEIVTTNIQHTSATQKNITATTQASNDYAGTATSRNWGGLLRMNPSNFVEGYWSIPSVSKDSSHGDTLDSSQWVGLGGWNEGTLIQAGTDAKIESSNTTYYPWYELLGTTNSIGSTYEQKISNLPCKPGDIMETYVRADVVNNQLVCRIEVANITTMRGAVFNVTATSFTKPTTAEWIVERPKNNNTTYPYPMTTDLGTGTKTVRFDLCLDYNADTGEDEGVSLWKTNLYPMTMAQGSNILAKPVTPGNLSVKIAGYSMCSNSFNVNWIDYGTTDVAS